MELFANEHNSDNIHTYAQEAVSLLPPDAEGCRQDRTKRAADALILSNSDLNPATQHMIAEALDYENSADLTDELCVASLLADLAHWCDVKGYELSEALRMAEAHYLEETACEGAQDFHAAPSRDYPTN